MAEVKKKVKEEAPDRVPYVVPLDPNDESDSIVVSVNGRKVQIQRGVPVMLKPEYVEVLEHSGYEETKLNMKLKELVNRR